MVESHPSKPPPDEQILDAAMHVFAERGFAGARVDEIARQAGVNKAMLYYHIGDKAALYEKVLIRNFDRLLDTISGAARDASTPADRFRAVVESLIALVCEMPEHPRIILHELACGGAHLPDAAVARMAEALATVQRIIGEGVTDGSMRNVDTVLTHATLVGAIVFGQVIRPIGQRMLETGLPIELPSASEHAHQLTDLLLQGLLARGGQQ